ncbi:hypothetical protein PUW24_03115 [Paenibacillus urinalis]|uniref:Uncharacterized protein n=1 Tax=Paenibacillus urinalis TaxID=521520 RepID=A0AAX3MWF6_9BACL|nr:hypothetical protein [Paenibacillus urinalis]WDH81940.1 hypothetical protein PUW23_20960 [Paenibacillus urinalis]WDH97988.1 hypothetical protein PUW24_03115 [Paenibacillus urinalis]WDI01669.1 hypothetical protein PUW25_20850 [Paenibacillus urinalis]
MIALLVIVVRKVSEPVFSELITQPITDKIARDALEDLPLPPSQKELIAYAQQLAEEGTVQYSTDLTLQYEQASGDRKGIMTAAYKETLLGFIDMESSSLAEISNRPIYEEKVMISSSLAADIEGEQYAQTRADQDQQAGMDDMQQEQEPGMKQQDNEQKQEAHKEDSEVQDKLITTDTLASDVKVGDVTDRDEGSSSGSTNTSSESTDVAADSEVPTAGNEGVALYVNEVYFDRYPNLEEALRLAALVENAALIDLRTEQVVWDNYKRSTD